MEQSKYTELEFVSPSEIKVDILSLTKSKHKFGEYHQSHKIKVKQVCKSKLKNRNKNLFYL